MSKRLMSILEAMFSHEIDIGLQGKDYPFQTRKNKAMGELQEMRFVEPVEHVLGGRFPLIVRGWALTHLGRMTYCASCKSE